MNEKFLVALQATQNEGTNDIRLGKTVQAEQNFKQKKTNKIVFFHAKLRT